jgi:predicted lipoprotein with Yx(FWY)xxD motif
VRYFKQLLLAWVSSRSRQRSGSAPPRCRERPAVVKIGPSSLGRILVDAQGKTLYMWAHDKGPKSTCYGDCATYWPPLLTGGKPVALAGAKAGLLGTSKRTDGRMQVSYAGHPLYYFVQDTKAGRRRARD